MAPGRCDASRVLSSLPSAAGLACALLCVLAASASWTAQAQDAEREDFRATARVKTDEPGAATILDEREVRLLRRRQGDGFRLVETLPGTSPLFSGVPYLLVRGAPPSGTSQYYDGVPVPTFFHLALGPGIAHPTLTSGMRFHSGVAPARYGRRTGGVLVVDGPGPTPAAPEAELEARLLDSQAAVRTRGDWPLSLHARLGYANALLEAIDSRARLRYWDYQAHTRRKVTARGHFTLHAFGMLDGVGDVNEPEDDIELEFHRLLLRFEQLGERVHLGASLYAGHDRGQLGEELDGRSLRLGPSLYVERRVAGTRVRLGADMDAQLTRLRRPPESQPRSRLLDVNDPDRFLPDFDDQLTVETGPEDFVDQSPLTTVPGRNAIGAYLELALAPARPFEVETGVRTDLFLVGGRKAQSIDPSMLARYHASEGVRLHAGMGTSHQVPSTPLPIPGLDDFQLDRGLSRAIQTEAGLTAELPWALELSSTLFHHAFEHLVFLELVLDCDGNSDARAAFTFTPGQARDVPLCRTRGLPRGDGRAYGAEVRLSRALEERLTGWLSYTLAWADARAADGTRFVPQFDVRQSADLVLSFDWGGGLESGARLHYRSGKPAVNTIFAFGQDRFERIDTRLPDFLRADLNLTYGFATSVGEVELLLSWANLTFAREATKRDCFLLGGLQVRCQIDYQPAIVLPNAGLRVRM